MTGKSYSRFESVKTVFSFHTIFILPKNYVNLNHLLISRSQVFQPCWSFTHAHHS